MHLATWHLHPPSISRNGSSSKVPLRSSSFRCLRPCTSVRAFFTVVGKARIRTLLSCVFLASAYMKWDGNVERRRRKVERGGGWGSEGNEEETKGRRELRYAVIRDRVRRGRTWTFFSMCAQESSLPSTSRFNRSPNRPPLVTHTEVPFDSVSFSSSYLLARDRNSRVSSSEPRHIFAVLTSAPHIFTNSPW